MNDDLLAARLDILRAEHRDLDDRLRAAGAEPHGNQFELARLKRTKLRLKDEIAYLEDQLLPDISA
jgi:hypothetical protein